MLTSQLQPHVFHYWVSKEKHIINIICHFIMFQYITSTNTFWLYFFIVVKILRLLEIQVSDITCPL